MQRRIRRNWLGCLSPLICAAILVYALVSPVEVHHTTAFLPGQHQPISKPLARVAPRTQQLPIILQQIDQASPLPGVGAAPRSLRFFFSTSKFALRVANATLSFPESSCVFAATRGILWDGDAMSFRPIRGECSTLLQQGPVAGQMEMHLLDHGSLALVVAADGAGKGAVLVGGGQSALGVWETEMGDLAHGRRLHSLATMWGIPPGFQWMLPAWVMLAGGVAAGGVLWWRRRPAIAVGLLSLALGMAYGAMVPPFQAPDEPDHFLSYARQAEAPDLVEGAESLARKGHFQRMKHNPWEVFTPASVLVPYDIAWEAQDAQGAEQVVDSNMEGRSALTTAFWRFFQWCTPEMNAAGTLFTLRLANVLLFALAAWGTTYFLLCIAKLRFYPWYVFFIPTLPFFAMHVSNYAQFTAASMLLGGGAMAMLWHEKSHNQRMLGFWIGGAGSVLVLCASTGVAVLPLVVCLAVAGMPVRWGNRNAVLRFWGGLGTGLLLMSAGIGSAQFEQLFRLAGQLLHWGGPLPGVALPLGVLMGCAVGFALERAVQSRTRFPDGMRVAGRWGCCGLGIGLAVLLVYAGYRDFSMLSSAISPGEMRAFVVEVLEKIPTLVTFREPDTLLSHTFWGGFGWHDAMLPKRIVQLLAGGMGVGVVLLCWAGAGARRPSKVFGWQCCWWLLGCVGIALATAFAAVAAGEERALPNIHGRYLLAFYSVLVAGACTGWQWVAQQRHKAEWSHDRSCVLRFVEGWLLAGFGVVTVLSVTRFSLPYVFSRLPVTALHVAMGCGLVCFGWLVLRLLQVSQSPALQNRLSMRTLLTGGLLIGAGILYAELGFGLPWVLVRYPYGFFIVLVLAGLLWLWGALLAPRAEALPIGGACWESASERHWPTRLAGAVALALHTGTLLFLLSRYFG